jgi:hypothetical protein
MRAKNFITLITTLGLASIFVLVLQPHIFQEPMIPLSMSSRDLDTWWSNIFSPTTNIIFVAGLVTTLIWFIKATTSKYTKSSDVLGARLLWWGIFWGYLLLSFIAFAGLNYFANNSNKPIKGIFEASLWSAPFLLLDVILLFWLPTASSTPKTLRYIPPFSMSLRKLIGD